MGRDDFEELQAQSDAMLLQRIATSRDHAAFGEVLRRYEQAAFSLAWRISSNDQTAEDAVQEAMIRVWQSAETFQPSPDGSCKGWLMKIVSNQTVSLLRHEARQAKRKTTREVSSKAAEVPMPETEGALKALNMALSKLPLRDQQIIALSFGGGMTNREIGEALVIPHSTLDYRIKSVLDSLRSSLVQAGILGSVSAALPNLLAKSMLEGREFPLYLRDRILGHAADVALRGAQKVALRSAQSVRTAGAAKTGVAVWIILGMSLLGAGGWWFASSPQSAVAPLSAAPTEESKLIAKWTFPNGPAPDLRAVQADWKWQRLPDQSGVMTTEKGTPVVIELPTNLKAQPIKLRITRSFHSSGNATVTAYWSDKDHLVHMTGNWFSIRTFNGDQNPRKFDGEIYLVNSYVIHLYENKPLEVIGYEKAYPGPHICLLIENQDISEIELRYVRSDELPSTIRQPEKLITQMEKSNTLLNLENFVFPPRTTAENDDRKTAE